LEPSNFREKFKGKEIEFVQKCGEYLTALNYGVNIDDPADNTM
jgi:hypothetical protein